MTRNLPSGNKGFTDKDYQVVKEPWNFYQLLDGPKLKIKLVLERVLMKKIDDKIVDFRIRPKILTSVYDVPESQYGDLGGPANLEIIQSHITHEVKFETIYEEWNEYLLTDGTRIRIKVTINEVHKTDLFDSDGEPIYHIQQSHQMLIKPAKPSNLLE